MAETKTKDKENNIVQNYTVVADKVPAKIEIRDEDDYVKRYRLKRPRPSAATEAVIESVKADAVSQADITTDNFEDSNEVEESRKIFASKARELLKERLPELGESEREVLIGNLIHDMLGLGDLEILLSDDSLEEIVVNNADDPAWAYHQEYGWLHTDISFGSESEIYNYASEIGRGVGKNISSLHPLLDAHLPSGDRANATLNPISTKGNTLTIRKFARDPWTITDFIDIGTISPEMAAFLWLCVQYEMNMLVSGGTGSGKTSLLNVLTPFIPANQRVLSIEDTRELSLPQFLHWVPMSTREENPDGEGGVSMQDLLVNSLRMRPDRILVGEIRRKRQAQVMFEAMQTGHSVSTTLHADTAETTIKRMTHPPIDVPETQVGAVDINVVMFRDRRRNFRRVREIAEVIDEDEEVHAHQIYKWNSQGDSFSKVNSSESVMEKLKMVTGLTDREIQESIDEKKGVLLWMLGHDVNELEEVGHVVAQYYSHKDELLGKIAEDVDPEAIIPDKE